MKIFRNDYNTPQMQIEENKKNIELLASYLKEVYETPIEYVDSTTTIPIASTNAPSDTTEGWIITKDGKLFKINSGDGTNFLVRYYCTFPKGDQGDQGIQGLDGYSIHFASVDFDENVTTYNLSNISQNTPIVANDVVLFKNGYLVIIYSVGATTCDMANGTAVQLEISSVEGGNVWHTWTQANFIDGEATFSIGNIVKPNEIPLNIADKILYVDNNDVVKECYMIIDIGDISVTLEKIGDIGGGKQLYQHNVKMYYSQSGQQEYNISFKIINDIPTSLTRTDVINYLTTNECNSRDNSLDANGQFVKTSGSNDYHYICQGIYYNSSNFYMWGTKIGETSVVISETEKYENGYSDLKDKVIPL